MLSIKEISMDFKQEIAKGLLSIEAVFSQTGRAVHMGERH